MSYNQVNDETTAFLKDGLTAAAHDGTITEKQLSDAIKCHYDDGDYIPESVGLAWMQCNTELLDSFIGDPAEFLIAHLDVDHFGEVLMVSSGIMEIVPEADRARVYQETFRRCGARNHTWVQKAIKLGVTREVIAGMLLEKLHGCTVDLDRSNWNFLQHDFLKYGSGRIDRFDFRDERHSYGFEDSDTYWSVLTDEQLVEVVKIIIEKAPNLLFEDGGVNRDVNTRRKLRIRLDDSVLTPLLEEAAGKLTSLSHVSLDELLRLPVPVQMEVARRTGGSIELVVRMALLMGTEEGESLLGEFDPLFEADGAMGVFRQMWSTLSTTENTVMADRIKRKLLRSAEAHGYLYGQVREHQYYNKKAGRVLTQMRVVRDGKSYVQDRQQHRYVAKQGDWVFYRPIEGRQLTSTVVSVQFIPAHNTQRWY